MMRHENPDLFDAKERYYRAQNDFRRAMDNLGSTIAALKGRILELTEAAIEAHKAEEDKP